MVFFAAACSGHEPTEPSGPAAEEAAEPASESVDDAAEVLEAAFEIGQQVTLQGQLGCGHCNFHTGEACSAALQVADGPVVILDVSEDHELYTGRFSGRQIEVVGTIASIDDAGAHVEVDSFSDLAS
jgi:hypothetical protein